MVLDKMVGHLGLRTHEQLLKKCAAWGKQPMVRRGSAYHSQRISTLIQNNTLLLLKLLT